MPTGSVEGDHDRAGVLVCSVNDWGGDMLADKHPICDISVGSRRGEGVKLSELESPLRR